MIYSKQPISINEQIDKLKSRGLIIEKPIEVAKYLRTIGYYRLSGYWWPLQSDKIEHSFKDGARFSQVISLYKFDSELRWLLFKAIEKIEISLRSNLVYHISH